MSVQPSRRILLVEDHADTAKAMARLLSLSGYTVETAGCCADALQFCGQATFDLIISDVGLPDGSGYDLMQQLINEKCTARGIAVSGYGDQHDMEMSRKAGFSEHLIKPVKFDALKEAIQRVICE
jgi:CheY-like chemotaxis protein